MPSILPLPNHESFGHVAWQKLGIGLASEEWAEAKINDSSVRVKPLGLYATEDFNTDDVLGIYTGRYVYESHFDATFTHDQELYKHLSAYLTKWGPQYSAQQGGWKVIKQKEGLSVDRNGVIKEKDMLFVDRLIVVPRMQTIGNSVSVRTLSAGEYAPSAPIDIMALVNCPGECKEENVTEGMTTMANAQLKNVLIEEKYDASVSDTDADPMITSDEHDAEEGQERRRSGRDRQQTKRFVPGGRANVLDGVSDQTPKPYDTRYYPLIVLYASKPIKAGEEILFDYGYDPTTSPTSKDINTNPKVRFEPSKMGIYADMISEFKTSMTEMGKKLLKDLNKDAIQSYIKQQVPSFKLKPHGEDVRDFFEISKEMGVAKLLFPPSNDEDAHGTFLNPYPTDSAEHVLLNLASVKGGKPLRNLSPDEIKEAIERAAFESEGSEPETTLIPDDNFLSGEDASQLAPLPSYEESDNWWKTSEERERKSAEAERDKIQTWMYRDVMSDEDD